MPDPKFGVIYSRLHPVVPIPEFAHTIEDAGYDSLWVTEGLVNEMPALDIMLALGAFVQHTKRPDSRHLRGTGPAEEPRHPGQGDGDTGLSFRGPGGAGGGSRRVFKLQDGRIHSLRRRPTGAGGSRGRDPGNNDQAVVGEARES